MDDDLFAESASAPNPAWDVMLKRGLRKRCPRCGTGKLFDGWYRMHERCDGCGFKFEREEGFFIGVYFINFAVTELFLFVLMMVLIVLLNGSSGLPIAPLLGVGLALAVLVPVVFYPFAKTIWSAIDLTMTPLELGEIIAARDYLHERSERG